MKNAEKCKGGRREGDTGKANGANGRRRLNNTGTLEKRRGKWLARWYVYDVQGKRLRKSQMLKATSLEDARKELRDLTEGNALITREKVIRKSLDELEGVKAELQRIEDAKPALKLADVFMAFKRNPNRPQSGAATLAHYEGEIERFVSWMAATYPEATEMREVSRAVAVAFLDDLAAKVSPNTYNKYVALLRLVWRTVGEEARCGLNPWDGVRRKALPKTNGRRALTIEELTKVTADLTGEMRLLFALGIYTGLRLGDCALMDWGKIDIVRRVIVTTPRKTARTGKVVEIPIHPVLAGMLAEIPEKNRNGYLLPETAATYQRDDSAVAKRVRAIFEGAGIATTKEVAGYSQAVAQVGFHSLRHSFVSLMGNAGAPLALVQSIVGHANPMMTAHYFHARTDALANAVGNLPALMGETIGADAATIAAEPPSKPVAREGDADGASVPANAATRLAAFKAAFLAMPAKERKAARAWIVKFQRG